MIHTVKGFGIVNKAEIDVFLELSCLFDDPVDIGNLISGSSSFSKSSLNIWKFMVHVLLKPGLENFVHNFTSMWDKCNCAVYLTEAEDIKKSWQEYTEELHKKDLHDPDNHNGMITHLEPDILECVVKWALGSTTMNRAVGGDGIPLSYFKS